MIVPALSAVIVGVALIEGRLAGTFQPLADLRIAFGTHGVSSPPNFPLVRDVVSMWFGAVVLYTCLLVHKQWQLMARFIPDLESSGAIRSLRRPIPGLPRVAQIWRIGESDPKDDAVNMVVRRIDAYLRLVERAAPFVAFGAAVAAFLLILGEEPNIFSVFAPSNLHGGGRAAWLDAAYSSWWAGTGHPIGCVLYFLVATLGIYIIVMQNLVGVACVYFVCVLPHIARFSADWGNADGHFGWRPAATAFRTVYWSLLVHGVTLAVLLVALGPSRAGWIAGLLAIWLIGTPTYIAVPWLIFTRVEKRVRRDRLRAISARLQTDNVHLDSVGPAVVPFLWEIDRVRQLRIRPLRMRSWQFSTIATAIALPVVIAVAQRLS
ncbi:MAG: hypothetical protein ABSG64_14300 [Solirubrobacteraceae bacterium]